MYWVSLNDSVCKYKQCFMFELSLQAMWVGQQFNYLYVTLQPIMGRMVSYFGFLMATEYAGIIILDYSNSYCQKA